MRPFIVRLAKQFRQNGWVVNTAGGLSITVEGNPELQQKFLYHLNHHAPPLACIESLTINEQAPAQFGDFQIKASLLDGSKSAFVLPDIATCQDCTIDIFNPASRFYRYPFTSCSHCGPRYSIMLSQPYDRERTTMAEFLNCSVCEQDYQAIDNRRFHAQTIACPNCGPALSLLDPAGQSQAENDQALITANRYLREGKIIAVKGVGGFQLLADATNEDAIQRLRARKHRPQKPFALMAADLPAVQKLCFLNTLEQQALTSYVAPIILLKRREGTSISDAVAPGTDLLGVMLAYSPLHHLLVHDFGGPLVATSGNRQNEPICLDNDQALLRLADIADFFLVHNRTILRPLDDSVVRLIGEKITVLRRARGYVPTPVTLNTALPDMLSVGGQLKNTVAISHDRQIIISQHLGDLDSVESQRQFNATISDLRHFYQVEPVRIMHDLHSGYSSSVSAKRLCNLSEPVLKSQAVQHHQAHVLSCMAEHGLEPPLLGVTWDGTGLGSDNTLWGGEFFRMRANGFQRFAHFRPFSLPGGTKAIQEPRRSALGLLYEMVSGQIFDRTDLPFSESELKLLQSALSKQINCPRTSSVGRLFDAIASLLGLCHINHYEGKAAMALENCASRVQSDAFYPFRINETEPLVIDWQLMLEEILQDLALLGTDLIAAKFHNTLAEMILTIAGRSGEQTVVLSGGCFQNALLAEKTLARLKSAGFTVYCHEKIPPNDGGLALGQLYAAKYPG
jgi:hydrogenase maturation protein HypF